MAAMTDTSTDAPLTIAGEEPTGAMVALKPADPTAFAVEGGDPPGAIHVTLKFLFTAEDWPDENRQLIEDVVQAWAARTAPFTAKVGGAGWLGKDDPPAAILLLDIPGIQAERGALANEIQAAGGPDGVDITDTHEGFIPHLTTGYGVEPSRDLMGSDGHVFDRVAVHWGPDVREFPLTGASTAVAALSEAEEDELEGLVATAEERLANLQALVASIKLTEVRDSIFDEDKDDDSDDGVAVPVAITAAAMRPFVDALAGSKDQFALVASLTGDLPKDLQARVEKLQEGLEALEETVAEMLEGQVVDEDMPLDLGAPGTHVDETLASSGAGRS